MSPEVLSRWPLAEARLSRQAAGHSVLSGNSANRSLSPAFPGKFLEGLYMEDRFRTAAPSDEFKANGAPRARFYNFQLTESDNALLQQLPASFRTILIVHGSYAEIAQQLNIAPGTVRSRLHRARKALTRLRAETLEENSQPEPRPHEDQAKP